MKKIILLLFSVLFLLFKSNSQTQTANMYKNNLKDVIFAPSVAYGVCTSYEFIFWKEKSFTKYNTYNFWVGGGIIIPVFFIPAPSFGLEGAFELRQYFKQNQFKKLNLDFYTGIAYMYAPIFFHGIMYRNFLGLVPGIKLSYKFEKTKLIIDPYISFSTPIYSDLNRLWEDAENFSDWIDQIICGPILTFGVRFSLNKTKKKDIIEN